MLNCARKCWDNSLPYEFISNEHVFWLQVSALQDKKELHNLVKDGVNKFDDVSLAYEYIVDRCKHINEVVICVIITERLINGKSNSLMHAFLDTFKNF